jgi:di/tripeptidase
MMGGHSGMEIGLGRGNANQQLARFIWEMSQSCDVVVSRIDGGNLANAIPREAIATIGIPADKEAELMAYAAEFNKTIHAEFALAENPDFTFDVTAAATPATIINKKQFIIIKILTKNTINTLKKKSFCVIYGDNNRNFRLHNPIFYCLCNANFNRIFLTNKNDNAI